MSQETIVCADVIATYKGQLVLIQRHTDPIGLALPGGKQNAGERLSVTAKREFLEETGLTLTIEDVLGTYTGEERDPRGKYVSTVFIGRAEGELRHEPGKTTVILMKRDQLNNLVHELLFDHGQILEDYMQSAGKSMPIKPGDVAKYKQGSMPDEVLDAFNELIVEKMSGRYAIVKQKDVVARMVEKGLKQADIYNKNWLDVEPLFRAEGWKVEYDKPGYNESYDAYFKFEVR